MNEDDDHFDNNLRYTIKEMIKKKEILFVISLTGCPLICVRHCFVKCKNVSRVILFELNNKIFCSWSSN